VQAATCPNRRSRCLSLNLSISKSVVRLNATEPAWPNTFQSPCARCIAAAGLGQSMGSPAAMPPSLLKSKGNATKRVIAALRSHFVKFTCCALREQGDPAVRDRKATRLPAGCSSIASSSRWNSATINSNRLRIAVSIIAAAKPFTRAIWERRTSTSGMAFTSVEHSLPATVPHTKMPKLQRRRERKSLRGARPAAGDV
jgi:hypothetical protein